VSWAYEVVCCAIYNSFSRYHLGLSRDGWKNWRVMSPAYRTLHDSLGRDPSAKEVYDCLRDTQNPPALSLVQVQNTLRALQSAKPESLDAGLASEAEGGPPHKGWEPRDPMTPDRQAMDREFWEVLDKGLNCLPPDQAEAFRLVWIQNVTQEQAASRLGVSQPQVCKLVYKAALGLRQHLVKHGYSLDASA
jgi:RNA polymerase sigma factor (sigma-70 family)